MNTLPIQFPTGEALAREIDILEHRAFDDQIRKTITDRLKIANDPKTVFIPNEIVFSASRVKLLAKLTKGKS